MVLERTTIPSEGVSCASGLLLSLESMPKWRAESQAAESGCSEK